MRTLLSLLLLRSMLAALCVPGSAAHVSAAEAIDTLETLGLVRGTGNGFEPERSATRGEAAVMLLRLLGKEAEAEQEQGKCPFYDGGWAARYLTYAARNGLVRGQSSNWYGREEAVSVRDYLTMVLRALGYQDTAGDFSWESSIAFADRIGLTHGEYTAASRFIREDMALVSYTALTLPMKGSELTLIERLYLDGAVSAAALKSTRLAGAVSAGKEAYDAVEIHEMSASAVFYAEMYYDEESLAKDEPDTTGSGFFVTGDGVAMLSYHELDNCAYARVTTTDGRRYEVTGVLGYDPLWDMAVVRVSRTDLEGKEIRFFPYLDIGDSAAMYSGERVYTVSNPRGLIDSVSEGILSNPARNVDDPDYPYLQFTAPISPGSSGGPLLNSYGEVVGILFGTYLDGQLLNLAVPINCTAGVPLTGNGTPLSEVKAAEDVKKENAQLNASELTLELEYEEETEILISHTAPGPATIQYEIETRGVVECVWGEYITKRSIPLYITGIGNGETEIEITFLDGIGNEDSVVRIHVTVTGAPEDAETEAEE